MWIYVISILTGLCLSSILYLFNKRQHYGITLTVILFVLRSIAASLLVLILFNPYIKSKVKNIEPATIVLAQDNSASLILTKDSAFYKNVYPLILDTLINGLEKNFIVDKYLFGNDVREFSTPDFQDYYTDFHQILQSIKTDYYKKNVGAVVLLSDGICNRSYQPEQNIETYPFPIYTVTLGDTTNYPDLYIKDVFYNKTSPTNTAIPLKIIANANNCRNKKMEIIITVNNETIREIEAPINSNRFSQTFDLNIDSEDEGVKQVDILIKTIENEAVTTNNKKRFFIEVVDKQYKVLFYAKSPHPDLGCLKNILGDHFEVETIFGNEDIPDIKNFDIIFLHQIPFSGMSDYQSLMTKLNDYKDIPVFHIIGEDTDFEALNNLQKTIKISKGAVNSILEVKPQYNPNFGLFNINNEAIEVTNTYPPLSLPHLEFSLSSNHDMLLQMQIRDVLTNTPLLSFSTDSDGRKNAFLLGTGIWRWRLNNFYKYKNNNNFEELFTKSIKYLLTEKDKELIISYQENYLKNEQIILSADLRNPSQELTNEPDLRIRIRNKHTKDIYEYNFSKKDKSYHLNINNLPEGIYDFTAEAEFGGKLYHDNGNFSVVSIGAEAQDLSAKPERMQLISTLTGGNNFKINELNHLTKTIENDERITSILREETNYKDLINMKSLFFVILSLVSIEWILRKMFGTY